MEVCREDNEERAIVSSSMNGMTYAVVAWLPIVIFPQTMAPDFRRFTASTPIQKNSLIGKPTDADKANMTPLLLSTPRLWLSR